MVSASPLEVFGADRDRRHDDFSVCRVAAETCLNEEHVVAGFSPESANVPSGLTFQRRFDPPIDPSPCIADTIPSPGGAPD